MQLRVMFRPGSEAAARLLGLPFERVGAAVFVAAPLGWSERELTSYIISRAGPYLASISSVGPPPRSPLGGCNCLGRRHN